jgi:hypothetical protein
MWPFERIIVWIRAHPESCRFGLSGRCRSILAQIWFDSTNAKIAHFQRAATCRRPGEVLQDEAADSYCFGRSFLVSLHINEILFRHANPESAFVGSLS